MTPSEEDPFLTTEQVAKIFAVTPLTVRDWCRDGKIKGVKIDGRNWRILRSEMVRYANERYGDATP